MLQELLKVLLQLDHKYLSNSTLFYYKYTQGEK